MIFCVCLYVMLGQKDMHKAPVRSTGIRVQYTICTILSMQQSIVSFFARELLWVSSARYEIGMQSDCIQYSWIIDTAFEYQIIETF